MKNLCRTVFYLLIFAFGGSHLFAQTPVEDIPIIDVDFTVYSLNRPNGIFYLNEGKEIDLRFRSSKRSSQYKYKGPNPVTFYTRVKNEAGELEIVTVGKIDIEFPGGEYLLYFDQPLKNGYDRFDIVPISDSLSSLPTGHFRIFNATGAIFHGLIDGRKISLPRGLSDLYNASEGEVPVGLAVYMNNKLYPSYKDLISLRRDTRALIFIFRPILEGSLIVQNRVLYQEKKEEPATGQSEL